MEELWSLPTLLSPVSRDHGYWIEGVLGDSFHGRYGVLLYSEGHLMYII